MADNLESKMRALRVQIEDESTAVNDLVDSLVNRYGREMERSINKVKNALKDSEELSNEEIERFVMEVPVHMYFALEGLEKLGIEGDNAKMHKQDLYNQVYIATSGTIEDKKKHAEQETITEQYVETAYARAYRKLKDKIGKAELVYTGCKKVLDKRTQEIFINKGDRN